MPSHSSVCRPLVLLLGVAIAAGTWGRALAQSSVPAGATLIDAVVVPADAPEPVQTRAPLREGELYLLEASGVFSVWPEHHDGIDACYGYAPWRVAGTPQVWAQLLVDDVPFHELARRAADPVPYQPGHVYVAPVRGVGRPLRFQIGDAKIGSFADNHGALLVRVYAQAPASPPPLAPGGPALQSAVTTGAVPAPAAGSASAAGTGTRRRWSLFGAGLGLFLGSYLLDVGITYGVDHTPTWESTLPVAGPAAQMFDDYDSDRNRTVARSFLGIDLAGQVTGLALAVIGLAVPIRDPQPTSASVPPPGAAPPQAPPLQWTQTPPLAAVPANPAAGCPAGTARMEPGSACVARPPSCPGGGRPCDCPEQHALWCHPECALPQLCDGVTNPKYPCGAAPTPADAWRETAVPHRCYTGARFSYFCPPGGVIGPVIGTDLYSDESSVCSAAVHAGRITIETGGPVQIEVRAGAGFYAGSRRSEVVSSFATSAACSFVFP